MGLKIGAAKIGFLGGSSDAEKGRNADQKRRHQESIVESFFIMFQASDP